MPLSFARGGEVPPDLDPALVDLEIQRAGDIWTAPGCTAFTFSYAGAADGEAAPGDGRNTIQWVNDWKARGYPQASPGATDVQYAKDKKGHWTIAEADVYLNLNFGWTTGVPTDERKSLQAVLTHELGHALGLLHPCELDGSDGAPKCSKSGDFASEEMYPVYSPDQTVLSDDDIAGVCFLYPPGCNDSSCPDGTQCVGGGCQAQCGDTVCPPSLICAGDRCVEPHKDCGPSGCVGQPCGDPSDCARHEFCDHSVCARGESELGDACSSAANCYDGACVDGACAESCASGESCSSGLACDAETGACPDELAPMGASCKFSTDCRGGRCLTQNGVDPVCTRSCDDGGAACPAGWECRHADDEPVCAPAASAEDGCTMVPARRSSVPYALVMASLCLASCRSLRRRRFAKGRL